MAKRVTKTVDEDHYDTLDKQEQLGLARQTLAGRERDHYRMSLIPETSGGQIPQVEEQIVGLREKIAKLEEELEAEEAAEEAEDGTSGS